MQYKELIKKYILKIKNRILNVKKRSLYCIVASIVFAFIAFALNKESIYIRPYEIKRGDYGTEKSAYKVLVDANNLEKDLELDVSVSSKRYTKEEADRIFKVKLEYLLVNMLGENIDYEHISEKLIFNQDLSDGIKANYSFEPSYKGKKATISDATKSEADAFRYYTRYQNLIDGYGEVKNIDFKIDETCDGYIEVQLSTEIKDKDGTYKSEKYMVPVIVISKKLSELESFKNSFKNEVKKSDTDTIETDTIKLPKVINGFKIRYKDRLDLSFLLMPVFGILIIILLEARDKEKIRDEEKQKKKILENDFSQIISKILLYVSSGMTVRNSMIKLAVEYQNKLKNDNQKHIAYDEIVIVKNKLLSGYSELRAYEEMAKNINMRSYTRFLNIIIQSIKNGNKEFKNIINMEVQDALYERKQRAKKLGEEASTKLVLPLMMMLSIIMIIIMVPAFMGM